MPGIAAQCDEFSQEWRWLATPQGDRVRGGEALAARTRLMDAYRRFPALDPQLPQHLMPTGWPREQARLLFERGYDRLGERPEEWVRRILTASGLDVPAGLDRRR
ncbi:PaaX family transcriptional regulator C-terminal domain-containing protein [Actinoplanes sp. ATCC 53533]|uniref:PaaX family transcriptional regulator C-terminal domain-containing protein n=1 Tax=Actinoplanes sp. ATCC 53533 TaxID=1288362 RepID=UPI0021079E2D|nr:PaaX family transcriptional regulator C-terminal domain-containing protein [Actinoplanes sp. ATCC 53533]